MTFNLYQHTTTKDGVNIRLVLTHKRQRWVYLTGVKVAPGQWSSKKQKAKDKETDAALQSILNLAQKEWRRYLSRCLDTDERATFGEFTDLLKTALDRALLKDNTPPEMKNPISFAAWHIQNADLSKSRKGAHKTTLKHLKRFSGHFGKRLTYYTMDAFFSSQYAAWRFQDNISINTVRKELLIISSWLRSANDLGYNPYTYHESKNWAPGEYIPKDVYLTFAELRQLYQLNDLPKTMRLCVDAFTIAAFTGVRFSDLPQVCNLQNLRTDADGFKYFSIQQQKTKATANVPAHSVVLEILQRRGGKISLPSIQFLNKTIKKAAALTSWGNKRVLLDTAAGGHITAQLKPKAKAISSHTARRSFATNMYLAGVSVESIMKITGHSTRASFLKYLKADSLEHTKLVGLNNTFVNALKTA